MNVNKRKENKKNITKQLSVWDDKSNKLSGGNNFQKKHEKISQSRPKVNGKDKSDD